MAYKHTQEQALDKCNIKISPLIEVKYRLLRKTGYRMKPAQALLALLEDAVKDVSLTADELAAIQSEIDANREKRMAQRVKVAAFNRANRGARFATGQRGAEVG